MINVLKRNECTHTNMKFHDVMCRTHRPCSCLDIEIGSAPLGLHYSVNLSANLSFHRNMMLLDPGVTSLIALGGPGD